MAGTKAVEFGTAGSLSPEELQLATRNHGLPLEALRYDLTPPGLHYLLVHYDVPAVDPATWTLEIGGAVANPLRLTLADLQQRPRSTVAVTMECAGNGRALLDPRPLSQPWLLEAVGTAEWTGTPLAPLLEAAAMAGDAVDVVFTGADRGVEGGVEQRYARALSVEETRRPEVILAYEMNGRPLPPQHGAPLRLVTPGWYGMTNVKWLTQVTVATEPFDGYQQVRGYHFRAGVDDDDATAVTRMRPRALMAPPGIPDYYTRRRLLPPGAVTLTGRAWSGSAPIAGVDVSVDAGASWVPARVEPPTLGPWAWQAWSCPWEPPRPGEYVLCCRATDETGAAQTDGLVWNVGGYANPAPQAVTVTVG